jgi:glycosyltransferase involved in cell wall biosynthesis
MKITVYVPCHNNQQTLPEVLAALRGQTRQADQHLFINDHCTDQSPAIAAEQGFQVHEVNESRGLAAGRNEALRRASGDVMLGIDADVVLAPDYLERLEGQFAVHADVAAIGGRLDERFKDTAPDLWRAVHMPQHHGNREQFDPRILFGATMACRVEQVRQIGGWDERYVTNYEDVDLCRRLQAAGARLLYAPDCQAWHLRRDTLDTVLRGIWNWNYAGFEDCFADVNTWIERRVPMTWGMYQRFRVEDLEYPKLTYISLLFPWSFIIRDLDVLGKTVSDVGSPCEVASLARAVLTAYGFEADLVGRAAQWLEQLAVSLGHRREAQTPLHPDILGHLRFGSLQSIPDLNYGRRCRA